MSGMVVGLLVAFILGVAWGVFMGLKKYHPLWVLAAAPIGTGVYFLIMLFGG